MKYTTVKNPKWANKEHSIIECEVNFNDLLEDFVPFSAVSSGDSKHAHEIFQRCVSGEFGEISEYVSPPDIFGDEAISIIRNQRNYILENFVDKVTSNNIRWSSMSAEQQNEWIEYRKKLLEITDTYKTASLKWNDETNQYDFINFSWPLQPKQK